MAEWGREDEHRGRLFTVIERVGASDTDVVGMSKRNLGRGHNCPKVIDLR